MNRGPAEILEADGADGIRNPENVLKEHTFMDTDKGACVNASRELHSALARYMWTEASTIVKSVTGPSEVQEFLKSYANYNRRTSGRICRVQYACKYPKPAKDVCQER